MRYSCIQIPLFLGVFFFPVNLLSQDETTKEDEKKESPTASYEVNLKKGASSFPSGFSSIRGTWKVIGDPIPAIRIVPEPLKNGRIEFGKSYSKLDLTLLVDVWAEKTNRIYPRMGIGLFGKNGFQLRLAPAHSHIELCRRGAVLKTAPLDWKPSTIYRMELRVVEIEDERWQVSGRVWDKNESRPVKEQIKLLAWTDELQFPLAGRSALVATPFSRESIYFNEIAIYEGDYDPSWEAAADSTGEN